MTESSKPQVIRRRVIADNTGNNDAAVTYETLDSAVTIPDTTTLLNDAKQVLESELRYYRRKTRNNMSLEPSEANILAKYIDILVKLSREEREQLKLHDYSKMSDEELQHLLAEVVESKNSTGK